MTRKLLDVAREFGALGLAAAALLGAVAVFHSAMLAPLEARVQALKQQASAPAHASSGATQNASDKVNAVYKFLKRDEQPTDWLAKLHAIATATGVQLKSANYRTPRSDGPILRYEIVLPITGTYAQIREFLRRSAAEIPVMSIDQVTLKREHRNAAALQAELRIAVHMVSS